MPLSRSAVLRWSTFRPGCWRASVVYGRQEQERFLNALSLIYGSHTPIPQHSEESIKQIAYGLFYDRLKKKFIRFHLSCPCVPPEPAHPLRRFQPECLFRQSFSAIVSCKISVVPIEKTASDLVGREQAMFGGMA